MNGDQKRRLGGWLLGIAVVLAVAGLVLMTKANNDADSQASANEFSEALGANPEDADADLTPAFVSWALAGFAGLSGVVFLASAPPGEPNPADDSPVY